jgi:hypothetical protein
VQNDLAAATSAAATSATTPGAALGAASRRRTASTGRAATCRLRAVGAAAWPAAGRSTTGSGSAGRSTATSATTAAASTTSTAGDRTRGGNRLFIVGKRTGPRHADAAGRGGLSPLGTIGPRDLEREHLPVHHPTFDGQHGIWISAQRVAEFRDLTRYFVRCVHLKFNRNGAAASAASAAFRRRRRTASGARNRCIGTPLSSKTLRLSIRGGYGERTHCKSRYDSELHPSSLEFNKMENRTFEASAKV